MSDEGKTELIIQAEQGKVIVRFPEPLLWLALDPANAVGIGKHLIDCAVDCGANVEIKVPRKEISREKRTALITRALHVQRSMTEQNRPPAMIAQHVVDSILSAIE